MALSKLMASVTIDSNNKDFGLDDGGGPDQVAITTGLYGTVLEVLADLKTQLITYNSEDWDVTLSAYGIVTISNASSDWDVDWALTDNSLENLLGFSGLEAVAGAGPYTLTATYRVGHGGVCFYPPYGLGWPADQYDIKIREQETDDGNLVQVASSSEHRYRDITFNLLNLAQLEEGGSSGDGEGGTVLWSNRTLLHFWKYIRDREFRFYEDRSNGTVATPGSEGVAYTTWRRRAGRWAPQQRDPNDWAWFDVTMPLKYTGG